MMGHDHSHADQSHGEEHGHHGPTFVWDVHLTHKVDEHAHPVAHHTSGADQLVTMIEDGDIAFFDSGLRRFWSNLLVNGFSFRNHFRSFIFSSTSLCNRVDGV